MNMILYATLFTLAPIAFAQDARLQIDATDLPRGLVRSTIEIDLRRDLLESDGTLVLRYPQWVPGVHAPGGPIQNIAGFEARTGSGDEVAWRREPGDVFRFLIEPQHSARTIEIDLRYIANQPTANSRGIDCYGSPEIGLLSPNAVLLTPERVPATEWEIETTLVLPDGWEARCSIDAVENEGSTLVLAPVDAIELVDTPIMVGANVMDYDLSVGAPEGTPPHEMHVFSEIESAVRIDEQVLENYRSMVAQATHMFGSHPFADYHVLLATSDALGRNGLEHLRSSFNSIPLDTLDDPDNLTGWDRMLVPHEYVHSWCGKYRRPAGMLTDDFHTPKGTELLWVYEGLTQYLGELLEVRSGMASVEDYRWTLLTRLRWARLQQGRQWRPLIDTTSSSHLLRGGSRTWGGLRRGQDYYAEGALIWMEADAIIRTESDGQRSLNDFCQRFFRAPGGETDPRPFNRDEVIETLGSVQPYDWDTFFHDRVETIAPRPNMGLAGLLGYSIQYTNEPPRGPVGQRIDPTDARDSLGLSVGGSGNVRTVLLGSPADAAGLAPGMEIVGVGEYAWSRQRFADALESSAGEGELSLLVRSGDRFRDMTIRYDGGPRYMTLVRDEDATDLLSNILAPSN